MRRGGFVVMVCLGLLRGVDIHAQGVTLAPPQQSNCADSLLMNCRDTPAPSIAVQSPESQNAQSTPRSQDSGNQIYVDSAGNAMRQGDLARNDRDTTFPSDPVTDLQKLTRNSTGEILPIFGRDFFQIVPSTFAPGDQLAVTPDYVVGPGDDVLLRLWGPETFNSQLTVDRSGSIYLPKVGSIHVAGLRFNELQKQITTELSRTYRNFNISVNLGRLRSIQVYVVGEARRPGAYTVSSLSTVLNALFASGGPGIQGSLRRIQVRRGGQTIAELDLYDLILHGDKSHDVRLETGDTLFIPAVGRQVALAGSVRHPAVYELKEDDAGQTATSLQDLLTLAGGFASTADPRQIRVERIDADLRRHAMTVSLDAAGRTMMLHDGDILYANHIASGFEKTVTIRGNLANPGRFAWHPGMRLSDLIPDREALLTGDYWRERNRMGVPTPLFEPYEFNTPPPANGGVRTDSSLMRMDAVNPQNGVNSTRDALTSVLPPSVPGQDNQQQAGVAAGGVISNSATELDRNAATEATNTRSRNSNNAANASNATNTFNAAGNGTQDRLTTTSPGNWLQQPEQVVTATRVATVIRIPAPDIDWSYAVVERLDPQTLKTSLVPFNLGRLVQDHDPTQNLELQPGDVVTILNQRDILVPQQEQTKFVRLEGEFVGAGVYSVKPDETLADLMRRVGGLTPKAYLYGSSFQRESARVFQQQRLDEYITQLSADMDRQTAVRGASAASGVSDPNALALERNLVDQLRRLRATGRVVLEFAPQSAGVESIPAIPLENGDVFRVPSRPNTVSVIGAVYGQNVFLYTADRKLRDYIELAGKPNRVSDSKHAFIIRADGSIFSRERAQGTFSNKFDRAQINPGDAIVIPEKLIRPTALREFLDYSQILSSFGLAAAAINVIR